MDKKQPNYTPSHPDGRPSPIPPRCLARTMLPRLKAGPVRHGRRMAPIVAYLRGTHRVLAQ